MTIAWHWVSYKTTFSTYLVVCILYLYPVCSLQSAFCTDRFYSPISGNKSPSRKLLSPVWGLLNPFGGLLTWFDDTLKQVLGLPNAKFDSVTQDELDDKLLSLPKGGITSKNKTKIVLNLETQPQWTLFQACKPYCCQSVRKNVSVSAKSLTYLLRDNRHCQSCKLLY